MYTILIEMKLFKIYPDSHSYLRTKCEEVPLPVSNDIKNTLFDMIEYLKKSQDNEYATSNNIRSGVGLSANQIGICKRFFAIYFVDNDTTYEYGLVNPKIISSSVQKAYIESGEGCLSVNNPHIGFVYRYNKIKITGFDVVSNKEVTLSLEGYPAIVFQHEYDHLNGILFYDRIDSSNPLKVDPDAIAV